MGPIEEFIARYVKEYDFYNQAGRLVAQVLESNLRASGIRCIVTSRPKSVARLEDKCRQRDKKQSYSSVEEIYADIVDLAGARVALYFPAERDQVDALINRLFHVLLQKEFPESSNLRPGKRFSGYSATHYRVQLKDHDLSEADKRYGNARIEIQVASVLMHAWSEVEHDLDYKPLEGELSDDEYAILDQLNGLVIAGEMALERLQKAGEVRVAQNGREFVNHYEVAVYLLGRAGGMLGQSVGESGLGRVDHLYELLRRLEINTPVLLDPYLKSLHGNLELRPLAEQVIDALLAEDESRYEVYRSVLGDSYGTSSETGGGEEDVHRQFGLFMASWIKLERQIRDLDVDQGATGSRGAATIPAGNRLRDRGLLDSGSVRDFEYLRRLRNLVVHGIEPVPAEALSEATERLEAISAELASRAAGKTSPVED